MDMKRQRKQIDDINKKTDSTINTKPYASAIEMVDAFIRVR